MNRRVAFAGLALSASFGMFTSHASAAALGFTGTGGFIVSGGVGNIAGTCFPVACDSGFVAFNTGALLADGVVVSGLVRQTVQENALGRATSALLRVTNIVATNTNARGGILSDTLFLVSDIFGPSLAGSAVGVGIIGSFVGDGFGTTSFAQASAQMNFLTTPLNNFNAPLAGFTLNTVNPFVTCVVCGPIGFWAANFGVDNVGGVRELIGAINFTIGPQSSVVLPGSLLIETGDNASITSELPEPATFGLLGLALGGLGVMKRRSRARA